MTDTDHRQLRRHAAQIRSVRPGDVDALKRVIDGSGLFPSELLDGMLAAHLAGEGADELWLTVDAGEGPLAIAYCVPEQMTQGTWNLLLIAVDPDRRSTGIGAALLEHIEQKLTARGERVLLVETSGTPEFERTRRFYRDNGYDEEARIRDFYDAGDDKIVFWKSLVASGAAPGTAGSAG
jgi:ribosomal protein S18 acetylase RimI-like enzyme